MYTHIMYTYSEQDTANDHDVGFLLESKAKELAHKNFSCPCASIFACVKLSVCIHTLIHMYTYTHTYAYTLLMQLVQCAPKQDTEKCREREVLGLSVRLTIRAYVQDSRYDDTMH